LNSVQLLFVSGHRSGAAAPKACHLELAERSPIWLWHLTLCLFEKVARSFCPLGEEEGYWRSFGKLRMTSFLERSPAVHSKPRSDHGFI
jgi:hypothetical protein